MKLKALWQALLLLLLFSMHLQAELLPPPVVQAGCCGTCDYGNEMVINGDFGDPNCQVGYSSDLNYRDCSTVASLGCGGYTETDDASDWNSGWAGTDHTGNGSRALLVDGLCGNVGPGRVWFQTVNVVAGESYCFSAWVKNVKNSSNREPDLEIRTGGLNGLLLASVTDLAFADDWVQLCGIFTATTTGPVELDVITLPHASGAENDFMVDDISFRRITNCEDCCDNIHVQWGPTWVPNPNGGCSGSFSVWFDEEPGCDFDSIRAIGPWTLISHDPFSGISYYTYVVPMWTSAPVQFDFLDANGNVICSWDTILNCEPIPILENGCCGTCVYGPEMVLNGDFGAPCASFYLSDLNYRDCNNVGSLGAGGFTETTDASIWNPGWVGTDHTGNGSRAMLVDGPRSPTPAQRAWFQGVNVVEGVTYCFSAWVRNVLNSSVNEPDLDLRVNGVNGPVIASVTNLAFADGWVQLCGTFTATESITLELDVVTHPHMNGAANDFMIDDISFRPISNCIGNLFRTATPPADRAPDLRMALSPNPASEQVKLALQLPTDAPYALEVVNLQGQVVLRREYAAAAAYAEVDLRVDDLGTGLYFFRIRQGQQTVVRSLMIQH